MTEAKTSFKMFFSPLYFKIFGMRTSTLFLGGLCIKNFFFLLQEHALESPTPWITTVEPGT